MSDTMTVHLSPSTLSALADGELSAADLATAERHLSTCLDCNRRALSEGLLKRAVARAGQRYAMPEALHARIRQTIAAQQNSPATEGAQPRPPARSSFGAPVWAGALAAILLLSAGSFVAHDLALRSAHSSALVAETVDEHIAAMAAAAPQVVSTDRHTVKPWFQGKLAFSFDLPTALPPDITLDGADLVQLDGRPTAQLLFSIGKHHASVFLRQRSEEDPAIRSTQRNGFHVDGFRTSGLDALAVSDADPQRLHTLALAVQAAQSSQ